MQTILAPRTQSTAVAKPFLKWAGGKTQLLSHYAPHLPDRIDGVYHEPFIGGGAMFFHLKPTVAVLSDINSRLINCYRAVRDVPEELIGLLKLHEQMNSEEHFYGQRSLCPIEIYSFDLQDAARFIYLNRTCFNGLYRVNSKGEFNVSYGKYKSPNICDAENLRLCSKALQGVPLHWQSWEDSLCLVRSNAFVFMDPPYFPIAEQKTNFNSYAKPFTADDHRCLADWAHDLVEFGSQVLIANADTQEARHLYDSYSHFRLESFDIHRKVGTGKGAAARAKELLVRSV